MQLGRRLLLVIVVVALIGIPAGVLRAMCSGDSCRSASSGASAVPFCSLPSAVRAQIKAGYRDGRSPDILMVTRGDPVAGSSAYPKGSPLATAWPSIDAAVPKVPLVFYGKGVKTTHSVPSGTTLDDVAPTEAAIIGLDRPHPEVRSGSAIDGIASGTKPRLILQVIWKGADSATARHSRYLMHLMKAGTGTLSADPGSEPLDPAAQIATIGTGALPYQHGITGTYIRNDDGKLVKAWSKEAPVSVVAALGDDLDHSFHQRPLVGVVGTNPTDRGAIGGNWYLDNDHDGTAYVPGSQVRAKALKLLQQGYGADKTTDLLAVVDTGSAAKMGSDLRAIVRSASREAGRSVEVTVAGTGPVDPAHARAATFVAGQVEKAVKGSDRVIQEIEPGGLFFNQQVLAADHITPNDTLTAVKGVSEPDGRSVFDDSFPGIAVSFSRYC